MKNEINIVVGNLPSNLKAIRFQDRTVVEEILQGKDLAEISLPTPLVSPRSVSKEIVAPEPPKQPEPVEQQQQQQQPIVEEPKVVQPATPEKPAEQPIVEKTPEKPVIVEQPKPVVETPVAEVPKPVVAAVEQVAAEQPKPVVAETPEVPKPVEQPKPEPIAAVPSSPVKSVPPVTPTKVVEQQPAPKPAVETPAIPTEPQVEMVEKKEYVKVQKDLQSVSSLYQEALKRIDAVLRDYEQYSKELKQKSQELMTSKHQQNELMFKLKDLEKRYEDLEKSHKQALTAAQEKKPEPVVVEQPVAVVKQQPVIVAPAQPLEADLKLRKDYEELSSTHKAILKQLQERTEALDKKSTEYDVLLKQLNQVESKSASELANYKEQLQNSVSCMNDMDVSVREKSELILKLQRDLKRMESGAHHQAAQQVESAKSNQQVVFMASPQVAEMVLNPFMLLFFATIICVFLLNLVFGRK